MNAVDPALALMREADALASAGAWADAAGKLERAAELHSAAARTYDESRCLQLAATLRRSSGDISAAQKLVARAAALAPGEDALEVSILAERAEIAMAQARFDEALALWCACLEKLPQIGAGPSETIAVLRRRVACRIALGALDGADADVRAACDIADPTMTGFLRVEQARLLLACGHFAAAAKALPSVGDAEPQLRAEASVVRAQLARLAGEMQTAREHALAARASALEATAPVPFFAASVELAEAYGACAERTQAYAALASAWVTLADLLGRDVAHSWVAPCLAALRERWGDELFAAAKQAHDDGRRAWLQGVI